MNLEELKTAITDFAYVEKTDFPVNERMIRRAISELRKEGTLYLPVHNDGAYYHIDMCSDEQIEAFAESQLSAWMTQYFNTILPIKKYIKEEKLKQFMGQLL